MRKSFAFYVRKGTGLMSFAEKVYALSVGAGVFGMMIFVWFVGSTDESKIQWVPISFFFIGMATMGLLIGLRLDRIEKKKRDMSSDQQLHHNANPGPTHGPA